MGTAVSSEFGQEVVADALLIEVRRRLLELLLRHAELNDEREDHILMECVIRLEVQFASDLLATGGTSEVQKNESC